MKHTQTITALLDKDLSDFAFRVYNYLTLLKTPLFINEAKISKRLKVPVLRVKNALKELQNREYITIHKWWTVVSPSHIKRITHITL